MNLDWNAPRERLREMAPNHPDGAPAAVDEMC
jgi:hypothetical protein